MFNFFSRLSLRNKLIWPANIVFSILMIGLGTFVYQLAYSGFQDQLQNKVASMQNFLKDSSKTFIVNWDLEALEKIVAVAQKDGDIDYALFLGGDGKALTKKAKHINKSDVIEIKNPIYDNDKLLGHLIIGDNQREVKNSAAHLLYNIILGFMLAQLLISLTLFIITNRIAKPLREVVQFLKDSTSKTNTVAKQMNEASKYLEQGVNSQSSSMQETVASMTEIKRMAAQSSKKIEKAVFLGKESMQQADDGAQTMNTLANSIEAIKESNAQLNEMVNIIKEISNKTNVINDIVFETRLLSFNASIEAARAGQHGKGFAVVAEEVGNLAQMSGEASKDISNLLEQSNKQVNDIVNITTEKVIRGEEVSKEALTAFHKISSHVKEIAQSLDIVTDSINEQLTGFEESSVAINEMRQVAYSNKEVSESSIKLAKTISDESSSIKKYTDVIEIITNGVRSKIRNQLFGGKEYIENVLALQQDFDTTESVQNEEKETATESKQSSQEDVNLVVSKITEKLNSGTNEPDDSELNEEEGDANYLEYFKEDEGQEKES